MQFFVLLVCATFLLASGFVYQPLVKIRAASSLQKHQKQNELRRNTIATRLNGSDEKDEIDETAEKYGLEAGLLKAMQSDDEEKKKVKPKELLAKYGVAYLATSITLAIISYTICYVLISNGVDVAALLEKIGIQSSSATANAGTAALAYAVHKAASPIRFPPTVALTPIVAKWIGKEQQQNDDSSSK